MTEEQATSAVANAIYPSAHWENENLAWIECPGIELHSNQNGKKDCRLTINDGLPPTIHCCHSSCADAIVTANFNMRSNIGKLKTVTGNKLKKSGIIHSTLKQSPKVFNKILVVKQLEITELPVPMADGQRIHLNALFEPGELVSVVYGNGQDGKPMSKGATIQMEHYVEQHNNGTFIRVNPMREGGSGDADVTAWRHCLIEMDKAPLEKQWAAILASNLPVSVVVFSGKRSYHALVKVDAATAEEFRERARFAADVMDEFEGIEIDRSALNPSRLSRLAGCQRGDAWQELMAVNVGSSCWDDFLATRKPQDPEIAPETEVQVSHDTIAHPKFYYRKAKKDFIMVHNDRDVTPLNETQLKVFLRREGIVSDDKDSMEEMVCYILKNEGIDYDGSLPGYPTGMHTENGQRYFCERSATWLEGVPSDGAFGEGWPTIWSLLQGLLGIGSSEDAGYNQAIVRLLWSIKVARESLKVALRPPSATSKRHVRSGQATVFCGPKDCGKSLLVNKVITPLLGGRIMDAHKAFASGSEGFNGELLNAEVWTVDDKNHANDIKSRLQFGSSIKSMLYSGSVGFHAKHKEQITIRPWARLFIMCNDEEEAIRVLPPMTPDIDDKIHLFRCNKGKVLKTSTMEEFEAFGDKLSSELPAFAGAIDAITIPERQQCQRNGVKCWHDPYILRLLADQAPEHELAQLLVHCMVTGTLSKTAKLGAMALLEIFRVDEGTRIQARNLLHDKPALLGRYLGRLINASARYQEEFGLRIELSGSKNNAAIYKLTLSKGQGEED